MVLMSKNEVNGTCKARDLHFLQFKRFWGTCSGSAFTFSETGVSFCLTVREQSMLNSMLLSHI